ncbi:MAG: HEAT repeat domain-containing protein [Planctomycetaceae bacterium]|nr:HEAT repeat domain-containing protein [Planctomycetaceae bacterium]
MNRPCLYICINLFLTISLHAEAVTKAQTDSLISDIKSDDPNVCSKAAIKLAEYGSNANDAFSQLVGIIRNNENSHYASSVLPYISVGRSIEEVLALTKDENSMVQLTAVECLKQFNLDKSQTLQIYTALLDHKNASVRLRAVDALCQVGAGEFCLDMIIELANHEDPLIKAMAVSALDDIGIANEKVEKVLLDSFSNTDKREGVKAALIYQKLFPERNEGIGQILQFLSDDDRSVRWHAVRAVGDLTTVTSEVLQLSRKLMQDEDRIVVLNACYAMIRHNIETERAWRILNNALESNTFEELISSLMVLRQLGPAAANHQGQLIKMVNHKDEFVELVAIAVLAEIQPSSELVLPVLERKLKETNDFYIWNRTHKTIQALKSPPNRKNSH